MEVQDSSRYHSVLIFLKGLMPKLVIQQPDYRNNGKLQFVTGYTGSGASMCIHLTREEYEARLAAKLGKGRLIEVSDEFYWELPAKWNQKAISAVFEKELGPGRLTGHRDTWQWEPKGVEQAPVIRANQIQTGLPPKRKKRDGSVNVVLAIWKRSNYCKTNTYIPRWQVVNTEYYHKNADEYEGWIELEDLIGAPEKKKKKK